MVVGTGRTGRWHGASKLSVGNDNIKVILDSLVNRRCLSVRRVGQKSLYRYEMQYLANDLKNLPVDNL